MKKKFLSAGFLALGFFILILLLRFVDVERLGPAETAIGLSKLNVGIHNLFGVNTALYDVTELLGIISFGIPAVFGTMGIIQLVTRKNLFKVDQEILALGLLYFVVLGFYVIFNYFEINYRPVLLEGETFPKASFPSSHTMMTFVVMGSAVMMIKKYVKNIKVVKFLNILCLAMGTVVTLGRFICGVHWFTDIIGGIIAGLFLLALFSGVLDIIEKQKHTLH